MFAFECGMGSFLPLPIKKNYCLLPVDCPVKRKCHTIIHCFRLALLTLLSNLLCLVVAGTSGPLNMLGVILIRFHTMSTVFLSSPLHLSCTFLARLFSSTFHQASGITSDACLRLSELCSLTIQYTVMTATSCMPTNIKARDPNFVHARCSILVVVLWFCILIVEMG